MFQEPWPKGKYRSSRGLNYIIPVLAGFSFNRMCIKFASANTNKHRHFTGSQHKSTNILKIMTYLVENTKLMSKPKYSTVFRYIHRFKLVTCLMTANFISFAD